jgi:putative aldouronate transport system permease protein
MVRVKPRNSEFLYQLVILAIALAVSLSALFPLLYVLGVSISSADELIRNNYFVLWPSEPTFHAYYRIMSNPIVWTSLFISVARSVVGPVLTLIILTIGAYVLSVRSLPGRKAILMAIVFTMLFAAGLIPRYLVMQRLGLLNSFWVYIFPMLPDAFGLLVIKIFIENLPDSLLESADIDGARHVQKLAYLAVPLAKPALAAVGMFAVVNHWNAWFDALVFVTKTELHPLQMLLRNVLSTDAFHHAYLDTVTGGARTNLVAQRMATVVIGILPMLMLYPFLQKYFVHGVFLGSVKE